MWNILKAMCVLAAFLLVHCGNAQSSFAQSPIDKGFRYLDSSLDRGIEHWYLYDHVDSGLNHLYPSFWFNGGNNLTIDAGCQDDPYPGSSSCMRIVWKNTPGDNGEANNGVVWHNSEAWDGIHGRPYHLTGAKRITGYIRSKTPGLQVSLFFGGVPQGIPQTYARLDNMKEARQWIKPTVDQWQHFEIDLSERQVDLENLDVGFGFSVSDQHPNAPGIFDLDEVVIEFSNDKNTPRLLPSYGTHPIQSDLFSLNPKLFSPAEPTSRNVAYVYDQALAILAYLGRGGDEAKRRAQVIGDALVYCAAHHRSFDYKKYPKCLVLPNGLMAGEAEQWSGHFLDDGKTMPARVAGWTDPQETDPKKRWKEDYRQVSTNAGDMAWAIIALVALYNRTGLPHYRDTAVGLGEWVRTFCRMNGDPNPGFTGGMEGWPNQTPAKYKSVEMNLDLIVSFYMLAQATKDITWEADLRSARDFVESMFDEKKGHYLAGVSVDPDNPKKAPEINQEQHPLDVNSWALLVLGKNQRTLKGFQWAEQNCETLNESHGLSGFAFSDSDRSGVWPEGTGQMIVCYRMLDQKDKADRYLHSLERMQEASPGGEGIVAASKDGLWTGFDATFLNAKNEEDHTKWYYFSQLHVGALSWFLFAAMGYNPYYQILANGLLPKLP